MNLLELLEGIKEEHLGKQQLEDLYMSFLNLFSAVELEIGELEKKEALFLDASEEKTDVARKRKWRVTEEGQRLITLKRQSGVIEKNMSAVKHRLYQIY